MSTRSIDALGHIPLPPYIKRADTRRRIASDTRRSSRACAARSPRRPRACTSRPRCSRRSTRAASSAPRSRCTSATAPSSRCASTESKITSSIPSATRSPRRAPRRSTARRREGRRVIAVGTTTTRALEDAARTRAGPGHRRAGTATLFIYPGTSSGDRRAADQLPPPGVVAADAGRGVRRHAKRCSPRIARPSSSATGSTATAMRC